MTPAPMQYAIAYLLPAAIAAFFFGINLDFGMLANDKSRYFRGWLKRSLVLLPFTLVYFWLLRPAYTGPFYGLNPLLTMMPLIAISFSAIAYAEARYKFTTRLRSPMELVHITEKWLIVFMALGMLHKIFLTIEILLIVGPLLIYLIPWLLLRAIGKNFKPQFEYFDPNAPKPEPSEKEVAPASAEIPTEELSEAEKSDIETNRIIDAGLGYVGRFLARTLGKLFLNPMPEEPAGEGPKLIPKFPRNTLVFVCFSFGCIVVAVLIGASSNVLVRTQHFASLIGPVEHGGHWRDKFPAEEFGRAVLIEEDQARVFGERALGQSEEKLGSRFYPTHYTKQRVRGETVWVAPLEFQDFRHFWTSRFSPGYVKIKAESLADPAKLVLSRNDKPLEFRYLTSCWSTQNLTRHLYTSGLREYQFDTFGFELDEDLRPWWIIALMKPSAGFTAQVVHGVAIVCPETGEIRKYGVDEVPTWIDTVLPVEEALNYCEWWGAYRGGLGDRFITSQGIVTPSVSSHEHVTRIWDKNGEPYYAVPMSIERPNGSSLVSYLFINSRTRKATEFSTSGADDNGARSVIHAMTSNYPTWQTPQLNLRNICGRDCWTAPVVSNDGIYQCFTIVDVHESKGWLGSTPIEALKNYLVSMSSLGAVFDGPGIRPEVLTVTEFVPVVSGTTSMFSFLVEEKPGKIFLAPASTSPWTRFTKSGDRVAVKYFDSDETEIMVLELENERYR